MSRILCLYLGTVGLVCCIGQAKQIKYLSVYQDDSCLARHLLRMLRPVPWLEPLCSIAANKLTEGVHCNAQVYVTQSKGSVEAETGTSVSIAMMVKAISSNARHRTDCLGADHYAGLSRVE
jgi:hypothetical protein